MKLNAEWKRTKLAWRVEMKTKAKLCSYSCAKTGTRILRFFSSILPAALLRFQSSSVLFQCRFGCGFGRWRVEASFDYCRLLKMVEELRLREMKEEWRGSEFGKKIRDCSSSVLGNFRWGLKVVEDGDLNFGYDFSEPDEWWWGIYIYIRIEPSRSQGSVNIS